jgi:hypothetical protein
MRVTENAVDQPFGVSLAVRYLAAPALLGLLAACSTVTDTQAPASASSGIAGTLTERPTSMRSDQLIGRWGVASFRQEKDKARTEAQARSQCKLPYVIAKGPSDGVMMHAADDSKLYELRLKGGSDGKTYLGFESPPGDWQDREIVSLTASMIVLRFVDKDANDRYGTFVYIRCGS